MNCISLRVFVGWCIDKTWTYPAVCTLRIRWPHGSPCPFGEAVYYSPLRTSLPHPALKKICWSFRSFSKPRETDLIQGLRLETNSFTTQSREAECLFRGSHTRIQEIALCGSRKFVTISTRSRELSVSRATWIQPTHSCLDSLILSFHLRLGLLSGLVYFLPEHFIHYFWCLPWALYFLPISRTSSWQTHLIISVLFICWKLGYNV